jgi:adenylate cyclase
MVVSGIRRVSADMENSSHFNRRLAAIAFADVAGYSRLMAVDDAETVRRWSLLRTEIMEPNAAQNGGRLAQNAGDALLIEFPSAVSAVRWGIDVQRSAKVSQKADDPFALKLRIGINIEDLIEEDGILQGDGVNIAARIQQFAEPGQVVITESVRNYVLHRLPIAYSDLGTPPLKNISRAVRVFAVEWSNAAADAAVSEPFLQWSTRPTMAVLPFRTIGGTDADRYFGEGMTEDIVTGLSQSRIFYVISWASTLRYRNETADIQRISRELGVRYILNGSVRRRGINLRISAELVDVIQQRPIWNERYDGVGEDLFEFQDRIVASIVGSLEPRLQAAEVARVRGRPTDNLDAYDCVLKAISLLYRFTTDSYRETETLIARAIALDPNYGQAYAYMAWRINFWVGEGRSPNPDADRALGLEAAKRAIVLDPEDSFSLVVAGHLTSFFDRKPNEAIDLFDSALALNENSAFAWGMSALTLAYRGSGDTAMARMKNVWRLSPFDPLNFYFWIIAGISEFVAGRYVEAIAWLRKSRRTNPRFIAGLRMLAASLSLAGEEAAGRDVALELLAADPQFRVSTFVSWYPLQRPQDLKRLRAALLAVGLPE